MNENQNEYVDVNVHDNYPDSQETINVPTMKVAPLKKICMTIGELPSSYLETMSYYEMLVWFIHFLRDTVIPTVNGNAEAVQEVQNVVMDLQTYINNFKDSIDQDVEDLEDYVNNYFENLDVQEEINNKLDEMAQDGTLADLISEYLKVQIKNINKKLPTFNAGFKIVGHRGAMCDAPENTLPSYIIAAQQGFEYGECDVQKTSDGVYILMHDGTVDAMTDGTGSISSLTYAEIQAMDIDAGNGISYYEDLKVPTLDEYLDVCYKYDLKPCIELKGETLSDGDAVAIYNIVKKHGLQRKSIIISSFEDWLDDIREIDEQIELQWVNNITTARIDYCVSHRFDIDTDISALTSELVEYAHNNGVKVGCWVVSSGSGYSSLNNYNLDYITINSMSYLNGFMPDMLPVNKIIPKSKYDIKQIENEGYFLRSTSAQTGTYIEFINRNRTEVNLSRCLVLKKFKCYGKARPISFANVPSSIRVSLRMFTSDDNLITTDTGWITGGGSYTPTSNSPAYYLIYASRVDDRNFTINDYNALMNGIKNLDGDYYIIEGENSLTHGSSHVIQLPDNTKITFGTITYEANLSAWGTIYSQDIDPDITFPIAYSSKPDITVTCGSTLNGWIAQVNHSQTEITKITVARPNSTTGTWTFHYIAIGR